MTPLAGRVGIVGATGVVGRELLNLLEERGHVPAELKLMASARSAGTTMTIGDRDYILEEATAEACEGLDVVFFCASGDVARELAPVVAASGGVAIDNSSAFRMDPEVPLVVPEVNPEAASHHKGVIANANCSTIIMLMALAPLHRAWRARRVVVSTYQAASGAGIAAMNELTDQTRVALEGGTPVARALKHPIAFNLFSHDSDIGPEGYCGEETKMILETRKILSCDDIEVIPTTVRVPVVRAHSEAIVVTFDSTPDVDEARRLLMESPGVDVIDDRVANRFPMPMDADGRDDIFVGRLRQDVPGGEGLAFFVCGDQIRKGAALNALQIAEIL